LYEGKPLYVRKKLPRNGSCEAPARNSGGNRFSDAQFHFMHIVPETHFGFGM
jgi:hypothetical protein